MSTADTRPSIGDALADCAPIPGSALGPALNEQGYYVGRVEANLYWVTDGTYQSAFLTTSDGVVLFDAPPTIGHNIQRAVDEIAAANGVSNEVAHLIYSHHHADHAGASSLFGRNITRIGHEETRKLLLRDDDPARPAPEETFQDRRTLEIGGERIELAWHGSNHSPDNIFIHLPDHDALMLVDIVNPGWAPVCQSNLTEDVPGYIEAPDTALTYPWKHFIGGHMGRLGSRDDVATHRQYMADIADSSRKALDTVDPTPYFVKYGENTWAAVRGYLERDHGCRRGAGHREVHRRSGSRRRLHGQHHVPRHAINPPRPRLRVAGSPLSPAMNSSAASDDLRPTLRLAIIVGSTRPGRIGTAVGEWAYEIARRRDDAHFELLDVADFNLPVLDEGPPAMLLEKSPAMADQYSHDHTGRWSSAIASFDGYVFVTPEYNHGIGDAVKNAIDFLYHEWTDKAAGFIGYGYTMGRAQRTSAGQDRQGVRPADRAVVGSTSCSTSRRCRTSTGLRTSPTRSGTALAATRSTWSFTSPARHGRI
jgi:NAD(P)H-dependent FMN reductase/glyoxylase-like metal-dependent hydrolase (beta-lactamase superfamily II)